MLCSETWTEGYKDILNARIFILYDIYLEIMVVSLKAIDLNGYL